MCLRTDRQKDNPIFYKTATYLDRLLVPELYLILNFMKIVKAVHEIYVSCVHGQTNNPIFYKVQTNLDRFLVPEIYKISNFVKIV